MNGNHWMPLYWTDFLGDTMHLSRAEVGSYMLLIGAYWQMGRPLPDDDERLRNICRCPIGEWLRTKGLMAEFFTISDGVWRHKRDLMLANYGPVPGYECWKWNQ